MQPCEAHPLATAAHCSLLNLHTAHDPLCSGHAGSTDTSLWTHYKAGEREYCGNVFPDGMRKNDRLAQNVLTPTTKAEDHDVPISPKEIVAQGLMSAQDWDVVSHAHSNE